MKAFLSFLLLVLVINHIHAQSELQLANIGDFTTTEGVVIKDCKVAYRTIGELNADKSNVVLWSTWFTGTTEQIINYGFTNSLIDTTGLYIILVDALTNGVSSSPSNTPDFPAVSVRDMVNSQYSLLVNHLNIDHVFVVMGISMGGIQTFDWVVAYPDFMDKAIPIVGSPKFSSYDLLVFQTMAGLMEEAGQDEQKLRFAYEHAHNILLMNINTPTMMTNTVSPDSLENYLNDEYERLMAPGDYLAGINAMLPHDIYKSTGTNPQEIKNIIRADMLIIPATQDHLVNPIHALQLAQELNAKLVTLDSDCGHGSFGCEADKIKKAITAFLE